MCKGGLAIMKSDKCIKYVKEIISEYPRIDTIIQSLEMKKDISNSRDVNSFIRSKNKINRTTETQAINSVFISSSSLFTRFCHFL